MDPPAALPFLTISTPVMPLYLRPTITTSIFWLLAPGRSERGFLNRCDKAHGKSRTPPVRSQNGCQMQNTKNFYFAPTRKRTIPTGVRQLHAWLPNLSHLHVTLTFFNSSISFSVSSYELCSSIIFAYRTSIFSRSAVLFPLEIPSIFPLGHVHRLYHLKSHSALESNLGRHFVYRFRTLDICLLLRSPLLP